MKNVTLKQATTIAMWGNGIGLSLYVLPFFFHGLPYGLHFWGAVSGQGTLLFFLYTLNKKQP